MDAIKIWRCQSCEKVWGGTVVADVPNNPNLGTCPACGGYCLRYLLEVRAEIHPQATFSWNRCPHCKARSTEMMPTDKVHEVTEAERRQDLEMAMICGQEVLACPCGKELTWFEMEKVTEPLTAWIM